MEQGVQATLTDPNIKVSGCYFLSLVEWACNDASRSITEKDLMEIYTRCIVAGAMRQDCFILDPVKVYNIASGGRYTKTAMIRRELGEKLPSTYIIAWEKPNRTHFTLCYKGESWDPLPPNRPAATTYKKANYRTLV